MWEQIPVLVHLLMTFLEDSAMRAKSLLAFAMAIGCGLVAMVGVQQTMKKQNADPDADKITLFVAATEIPPGQVLDIAMLEKKKFLKATAPKEAVTDVSQLEKRALIVKVMPGDIIRLDKLGEEGKTGASISIPAGMRVHTVPANMTFGHSGMLKPEDRVDIMVTYKVKEGRQEYSETKTFLSYIEVFATDSVRDPNAGADPSGKASILKNISLLVTPEQAQTLAMAKSIGELTMNLRNTADKTQIEVNNLTPEQFRTQILQASIPPDEPQGRVSQPIDPPANNPVAQFADEMIGAQDATADATTSTTSNGSRPAGQMARQGGSLKNSAEPTKEAWDITIFNKATVKVETVEVDRRKEPAKATRVIASESSAKKILNSIVDMFETPKTETVALKPVQVGRPIYPDTSNKASLGNLQARLPRGAGPQISTTAPDGNSSEKAPEVAVPNTPAEAKPAPSAKSTPEKSAASKPATPTKTALTKSGK